MIKKKERNPCSLKRADARLTCGSSPISVLSWDGLTPGLLEVSQQSMSNKLMWTNVRKKGETGCLSYFYGALGCGNECSEVDIMTADEKCAVTLTVEPTICSLI